MWTTGERGSVDRPRIEAAIREILIAIGEDPDREGLRETPARVARSYDELFAGLSQDPAETVSAVFDIGHHEMILVKDIAVYSICEHHLLPFHGVAHVAYIPGEHGRITGLSKLARLVDVYARRPQVQERLAHADRRRARRARGRPRRDRRARVRAPVHVDAGRAQAGGADGHVRGPGRDARRRDQGRGDEPHRRPVGGRVPQPGVPKPPAPEPRTPETRCLVIGVLNVTPDSFSDGGRFEAVDDAIAWGLQLAGRRRRHRRRRRRVDAAGRRARRARARASAHPTRGRGPRGGGHPRERRHDARRDRRRGDRGGREHGERRLRRARRRRDGERRSAPTGVDYIAMHWRAHSDRMDDLDAYADVVAEVRGELEARVAALTAAGIDPARIILDPGLGFSKVGESNWPLLANLDSLMGSGIASSSGRRASAFSAG